MFLLVKSLLSESVEKKRQKIYRLSQHQNLFNNTAGVLGEPNVNSINMFSVTVQEDKYYDMTLLKPVHPSSSWYI